MFLRHIDLRFSFLVFVFFWYQGLIEWVRKYHFKFSGRGCMQLVLYLPLTSGRNYCWSHLGLEIFIYLFFVRFLKYKFSFFNKYRTIQVSIFSWVNYGIVCLYRNFWASLIAQLVKNLPVMQETPVWFLGQEDPLEKA